MTSVKGTFPTHSHYVDDGCEVSPSCLSCPLPLCKYDDPGGYQNWLGRRRRARLKGVEGKAEGAIHVQ
jgi:hypothetical protein